MTQTQLLLAVTILQQGFFALVWAGCVALQLARRASVHWALASLVLAVSQVLIVQRADLDVWVGGWLPNVLNLMAFALVRRGVQVFIRKAPTDGEQLLVLLVGAVGVALALGQSLPGSARAVFSSATMAWIILRCATEIVVGLSEEFGRLAALICAVQVYVAGLVIGVRPIAAWLGGHAGTPMVQETTVFNVGLLLTFVALGFMLMSSLVGMVVARLVMRLRRLSLHDPLTQALNRRGLEDALARARSRLSRQGEPVALLMVDIDHFKAFNDQHGHAVGDAVLVGVAHTLQRQCREVDVLGRIGGEEFAVLLPGVVADGALTAAERMREAVSKLVLEGTQGLSGVTISIGVAVVEHAGEPLEQVWRRVDKALYAAKEAGRNKVQLAEIALA
jgi:diguanylate cyclase (GGDEF)-like protein